MEGAGIEPLSRHTVVSETADGDVRLAAHVAGLLFHRVFLSSCIGSHLAYVMVGCASSGDMAHFPHSCQMGCYTAHSFGCSYHHGCRLRILDLLPQVARTFLCGCDGHYAGLGFCMAFSFAAR